MSALKLSPFTGRPLPANSAIARARIEAIAAAAPLQAARREAAVEPQGLQQLLKPAAFGRWILPQLVNITPTYIESVLRGAFGGSHIEQWQLFDLMEDTWPRLTKNLNEIKRAVISLNWEGTLTPWAEENTPPTDSAVERAKLVSNALWRMEPSPCHDENGFQQTIYDVLDAWGKGISVCEILWHIRRAGPLGDITAPRATLWVRPDNYAWSTEGVLGLNPNALERRDGRGAARAYLNSPSYYSKPEDIYEFPEDKFLIAIAKAKTGHPIGSALLRPLAWWWCAANFSADWLMNLAQIFGLPFRWANYASGTSEATIAKVCSMLENMGSAAWGAFPEGTTIDFKEASRSGDHSPQGDLIERADKNCDLLILGQTLTSDTGGMGAGGGSLALGKVHQSVKEANIMAAGSFVAEVINRQLIPAILRQNYGDTEEAPEFKPEPHEDEDQQANATRDAALLAAGVELPKKWFYKRHDIPLPQKGEETIGKVEAPAAPAANSDLEVERSTLNVERSTEEKKEPVAARAATPPAALPASVQKFQQRTLAEAAASDLAFIAQRGNALLRDLADPNYDDAAKMVKAAEFKAWLEKVKPTLLRHPALAQALEETTAQTLANTVAGLARRGPAARSASSPTPQTKP